MSDTRKDLEAMKADFLRRATPTPPLAHGPDHAQAVSEPDAPDAIVCEDCETRKPTEVFESGVELCGPCAIQRDIAALTPEGRKHVQALVQALRASSPSGERDKTPELVAMLTQAAKELRYAADHYPHSAALIHAAHKCASAIEYQLTYSVPRAPQPSVPSGEAVLWAVYDAHGRMMTYTESRTKADAECARYEGYGDNCWKMNRPFRVIPLYAAPPQDRVSEAWEKFGRAILREHMTTTEGVQDLAEECGVIVPVQVTEPCVPRDADGEARGCACYEADNIPGTCYRPVASRRAPSGDGGGA